MKLIDLMEVCVIHDEKFRIWDNDTFYELTKNDILFMPYLLNREIDYLYNSPATECISVTLVNQ